MKIKEAYWFSAMPGTIGVVVGEDDVTGKHKGYIGIVSGYDEDFDKKKVAELGSPVDPKTLREIADYLSESKTQKTLELNERELAVLLVSLELREMHHSPLNRNDRAALKRLIEQVKVLNMMRPGS